MITLRGRRGRRGEEVEVSYTNPDRGPYVVTIEDIVRYWVADEEDPEVGTAIVPLVTLPAGSLIREFFLFERITFEQSTTIALGTETEQWTRPSSVQSSYGVVESDSAVSQMSVTTGDARGDTLYQGSDDGFPIRLKKDTRVCFLYGFSNEQSGTFNQAPYPGPQPIVGKYECFLVVGAPSR